MVRPYETSFKRVLLFLIITFFVVVIGGNLYRSSVRQEGVKIYNETVEKQKLKTNQP